MPYKFETDKLKISPKHDKRIKLTNEDKENIRKDYATGLYSQRKLAEKYNVSRRLIVYILYPDRYEKAKELHKQRRKDGRYYNKERHREYMNRHRQHKKELHDKGLLKGNGEK